MQALELRATARGSAISLSGVPLTPVQEDWFTVYSGSEDIITVSSLKAGTKYALRVKAFNEVGESDWTERFHAATQGLAVVIPSCILTIFQSSQ